MKRLFAVVIVFLLFSTFLLTACVQEEPMKVAFYRKVAREVQDDGWVFTFVNNGLKDPNADDSDCIRYQFFGINIRYRYDDDYYQLQTHESKDGKTTTTWKVITPLLLWGQGSAAQARDRVLIDEILDFSRTPQELLALDPKDYTFETLDSEMVFRLVREALSGEPQKEGQDPRYWELPSYALLSEPQYVDGYEFQVGFLKETGCVDELYIDVLYQTGTGYNDYVQLSDLVENGTATEQQQEAFALIGRITEGIKESESFIYDAGSYRHTKIGQLNFARLYTLLNNIHNNKLGDYHIMPITVEVKETP